MKRDIDPKDVTVLIPPKNEEGGIGWVIDVEPIRRGIAEHVIGNRLINFEKGAFTKLNLIGNKIFNALFRFLYGVPVYDMLTGYRALTKDLYKSVELEKHGFEVETELTVETVAKGFRIVEVSINYYKREGKANLHPIKDKYRLVGYSSLRNTYISFSRAFLLIERENYLEVKENENTLSLAGYQRKDD